MRLKQESLQRGGDTKSVELVMENGQAYPLKGRCSSLTSLSMKARLYYAARYLP
jgi:hypothetical protein